MTEFIQVMTTVDSREGAERIAEVLLEQRLTLCVQIGGPISSRYWWQGAIETSEEWLCLAKRKGACTPKSSRQSFQRIRTTRPEVVAMPVSNGSAQYFEWLGGGLRST